MKRNDITGFTLHTLKYWTEFVLCKHKLTTIAIYKDKDYLILHDGSLWAGESNKQNTLGEILALTKEYHFEDFTKCYKHDGKWLFWGNFREYSNVFNVEVYNEKLARTLQRFIKAHITA